MDHWTQTKEGAIMFQKDDLVKTVKKGVLNVGKVQSVERSTVYVWSATTGQNDMFDLSDTQLTTKEEYDEQVKLRLNPPKKVHGPLQQTKKRTIPNTYRWECLECGNKYNGRECPSCGGEDRILNNAKDADANLFGLAARTEPMSPPEG